MITLEQHLADHAQSTRYVDGFPRCSCKCGAWMAEVDDRRPTQAHRSHVADAWREAQDAEAAAYVGERVDRIIKSGERDDEMAHNDEDKLLADLVDSYAPPEVKAHVARLAAAPFARWCA